MTREQLIEKLWEEHGGVDYSYTDATGNPVVETDTGICEKDDFVASINAALDAQAHGTHKEMLERANVVGKEWMLVAEVLSIISSADPEVEG